MNVHRDKALVDRFKKIFSSIWLIVVFLVLWEFIISIHDINSIVMVSPKSIVMEIVSHPAEFASATFYTTIFATAGLGIGMTIGTGLAIAAWLSRFVSGLFTPVSVIFSSIPVVAIIPIIARIFGYQSATVLAIVTIISFFPAFVFTSAGLRNLPQGSADLFHVLGAGKFKTLFYLALPSAIPQWAIALRLAATNAILSAVIAEFLMGTRGLGYIFNVARGDFAMGHALGASAIAAMLSIVCFFMTQKFERSMHHRWK